MGVIESCEAGNIGLGIEARIVETAEFGRVDFRAISAFSQQYVSLHSLLQVATALHFHGMLYSELCSLSLFS